MTHLPNIDALTGEQPDYGQVVVTQSDDNGGLNVLGVLRVFNHAVTCVSLQSKQTQLCRLVM